jgi:hypothetical protein
MGLLVSATAEKKISIQGTEIKLKSVYVRVEYSARANGVTLEIAPATYTSKEVYKAGGDVVLTDVPQSNITIDLVEGQMQDLSSAELYSKLAFEQMGYDVQ